LSISDRSSRCTETKSGVAHFLADEDHKVQVQPESRLAGVFFAVATAAVVIICNGSTASLIEVVLNCSLVLVVYTKNTSRRNILSYHRNHKTIIRITLKCL